MICMKGSTVPEPDAYDAKKGADPNNGSLRLQIIGNYGPTRRP